MIDFIKVIVVLGLIAFPIIKSILDGAIEIGFLKGILFGINYDCSVFEAKTKEDELKLFRVHVTQFHLGFFTVSMAFSKEADDLEKIEDEE